MKNVAIGLFITVLSASQAFSMTQHCGGPCEGGTIFEACKGWDDKGKKIIWKNILSSDKKYEIDLDQKGKYGHGVWKEDGKTKFDLDLWSASREFGFLKIFISPTGNGFILTGNPKAFKSFSSKKESPLFIFNSPDGKVLSRYLISDLLDDSEKSYVICPTCKCCKDVMYDFAEGPSLSKDGYFVELKTSKTSRTIRFFLPAGIVVNDGFEGQLLYGLGLTHEKLKSEQDQISKLVKDLDNEDPQIREKSSQTLVKKGHIVIGYLEKVLISAPSEEVKQRVTTILKELEPWKRACGELILRDLKFIAALLSYPKMDISKAANDRLLRILPEKIATAMKDKKPAEWFSWLEENETRLKWNDDKHIYELR